MKAALTVFILALLVRFVALAHYLPKLNPDVDLDSYRSLARSLATGRGFVGPDLDGKDHLSVARTPVYPLLLACLMKLGGDRLGFFLVAQCVLGAATCALTTVLARRWFSALASTVTGLLVALDPNSVIRCVDLRTETMFTLLLVASLCLLTRCQNRGGTWLAAGIFCSLAALTRPIAVWLWLIVALAGCVERMRATNVLLFLVGYMAVLGIWVGRNIAVTGRPFVSTIATYNLLMYRAAAIEAKHTDASLDTVQTRWRKEYGDLQWFSDRPSFDQQLRNYRATATRIIRSDPTLAVRQMIAGWGKILFGPGVHSLDNSLRVSENQSRLWPRLYVALLVIVIGLSIAGAWRLGREATLLSAVTLCFVLLAGGPEGNSRFRTPITPTLAVLAIAGTRRT